jgi:hypothetical protein
MLAPQLEAAKAEEERRAAEEKKRQDEEAARVAEQKRLEAEERARNQPPPAVIVKAAAGPTARSLSWIPGVIGLASAGAATALFVDAGSKQTSLLNGSAAPAMAVSIRDSGKLEATLGYVFTGVGVAGIGAAALMFVLGGSADAPTVSALPLQGGGYVSVGWNLDLGATR